MQALPLTIAGNEYQFGRLNAFQQLHVSRRLVPILGALAAAGPALVAAAQEGDDDLTAFMAAVGPAVAGMSDADVDYVIKACLGVTSRRSGERWSPVLTRDSQILFSDIDMTVMLRLAVEVCKENLSSFFGAVSAGSGSA